MRQLSRSAVLAVALAGVAAVPAPVAAAPPERAYGPEAGQLIKAVTRTGDRTLRATVPLGAQGEEGDELRGLVAASGAVDGNGRLTDVIATQTLDQPVGEGLLGSLVELNGTGTFWWQVEGDAEPTPPVSFEVALKAQAAPPAIDDPGRHALTPRGYRGLRTGMTLAQARRASHIPLKLQQSGTPGCAIATGKGSGVAVMFLKGKLVRISGVRDRRMPPALGNLRIGDPIASVGEIFGRSVITTDHAYVPGAFYWDVDYTSGPYKHRSIRFVGNREGTIDDIIVGLPGPVGYVEGCA